MIKRAKAISLFRLALAVSAVAISVQAAGHAAEAAKSTPSGSAGPAKSHEKIVDDTFSAEIVVSLNRGQAIEEYKKTGIIPLSDVRMTTDEALGAVFFLSGCRADAEGNCNVTARSRIVRSDGDIFSLVMPGWKENDPTLIPVLIGKKGAASDRKFPYPQGQLNFALNKMQPEFKPEAVAGDYLFLTVFTDNNTEGKEQFISWKAVHVSPGARNK